MASVTQRVKNVSQPYGGYIPSKLFKKTQFDDGQTLDPNENTRLGGLEGITVDYFSRFLTTGDKDDAWRISLHAASLVNRDALALKLLDQIDGLNDHSLQAAFKLARFDVAMRMGPSYYMDDDQFSVSESTINNTKILISRIMDFFKQFGQPIHDGMNFLGGYTTEISSGDADFMTEDTLWDLKIVRSNTLDKKYKLQVLVYYLMGKHSVNEEYYFNTQYIGLFNPRENAIYRCKISDIPKEVIQEVETKVIGY